MLPERYWQGRRYCNFPYMWLNLPCSADPRFIRRKRYGQHYSRLLLRLPYHFQGSHVPTRKRRTTGVKGSSLHLASRASERGGDATKGTCRLGIERQRFEVSFGLLQARLPGSALQPGLNRLPMSALQSKELTALKV